MGNVHTSEGRGHSRGDYHVVGGKAVKTTGAARCPQVKPRQVTLTATQCLAPVTCEKPKLEMRRATVRCLCFIWYNVSMLRERKIRYKVSTRDDAFERRTRTTASRSHARILAHGVSESAIGKGRVAAAKVDLD